MRLLQILNGSEPGGVKTLADDIGAALAASGIAVETRCLFPADRKGLLPKLGGTLRMATRILAGRYDALVAYQSSACITIGAVGRLAGCPRRIAHQTVLPAEVKAPLRWLDRLVGRCGLYTANVANSRATFAAFADYPANYRRDMILIEHGVAMPPPRRGRAETLRRFGIPDDGAILLNVGRLAAQKNQDVLIAALSELPAARLVVAGGGPLRERHEALARRAGVADRLHLLGDVARQDVADLLASTDLFVFPSLWETFGIAAVEAASAGLPLVVSDLPVLREVLESAGVDVRYAPPQDAPAWAAAIRRSLGDARSPRAPAGDLHPIGRMADAYLALLARPGRAG